MIRGDDVSFSDVKAVSAYAFVLSAAAVGLSVIAIALSITSLIWG